MPRFTLFAAILVACSVPVTAAEPSLGPAIEGYGPTYPVTERDVRLPKGYVHKLVFDVAADPDSDRVNRNLVSVARYLNMHARHGVPTDSMKLAVVVHGKAVSNLVDSEDNPNRDLLGRLQVAGVKVYICGQSMTHRGLTKSQLVDGVDVALSAMTMLTILQADGYALLPWGAQ